MKVITLLATPVTYTAQLIHLRYKIPRRVTHVTLGGVLFFLGPAIASLAPHESYILHVLVDAFGYGIHAVGLAPFLPTLEKVYHHAEHKHPSVKLVRRPRKPHH